MKQLYVLLLLISSLFSSGSVKGQMRDANHLLRIHEDNDFFNLIGIRTDRSYTNGSRVDYFQRCPSPSRSWLYRKLPTAGDSSINMCGWSAAQLMVTPDNITTTDFQNNDYRYAGSLFITNAFHSYNPIKKFSYQYEALLGIRGPEAMARQTQTAIHRMINSDKPQGWNNQLGTQLLVNLTFTAERNFFSYSNLLEVNGGVQARVGTLMDAMVVYPVIRIGKMSPYFNGLLSTSNPGAKRRRNNVQYYVVFKPTASFIAYNAMLEGKRANAKTDPISSNIPIARYVGDLQAGIVISYRNVGVSYLLTRSSAYDKGLYQHRYGTLEIYFRW
jgi:hypothetical protein